VTLDSGKWKTPNPDRESGATTVRYRDRAERKKDLWIGSCFDRDSTWESKEPLRLSREN
jgi:hypothetical protein